MWPWIGFPIGVIVGLHLPVVLSMKLILTFLCSILIIVAWLYIRHCYWRGFNVLLTFSAGILLVHIHAGFELQNWQVQAGKNDYVIWGRVAEVKWPEQEKGYATIIVNLKRVGDFDVTLESFAKVKLNLYRQINRQAQALSLYKKGMVFKAQVLMQPLSGTENGSGFNSVAYWRSKGVVAKGYVKVLSFVDTTSIINSQQRVLDSFYRHLSKLSYFEQITALTLGQKQGLSFVQKNELNELGLSHLFAISGLHITVIFGFVFLLLKTLARFARRPSISPLIPSLVVIWYYIWLIGAPISALRAGLAITLVSICFLLRIKIDWFKALCGMMSFSLLVQPYSVLVPSWWLSFSAVFVILIFVKVATNNRLQNRIRKYASDLVKLQVWVGIALVPMTVFWFQQIYFAGFITNLLAIPVFSLLLIPLCFVATLTFFVNKQIAITLFQIVDAVFEWLWAILNQISAESLTLAISSSMTWYLVLLIWAGFVFAHYGSSRLRWLCFVIILSPLLATILGRHNPTELVDDFELVVVDVGQGTSLLVTVGQAALVFDLGPVYPNGASATDFVLTPLLLDSGITEIEGVWVSHFDSDHRGHLAALLDWPIRHSQFGCGVESSDMLLFNGQFKVSVLWPSYPEADAFSSKNDLSCVVKLQWPGGAILLPGDIGRRVEQTLVQMHQNKEIDLSSDFIVAPHHGSQSSSSKAFIKAVAPKYAFHTNGVLNRFGFPNESVEKRYAEAGVVQLQTAKTGLIRLQLATNSFEVKSLSLQLDIWTPFWKRQNPFSFSEQIR